MTSLQSSLSIVSLSTFTTNPSVLTCPDARAYYFRQILHNFDDDTCIQILQMHLPALLNNPNSRIYIDDKTLPDEKPDAGAPGVEYTAALSLAMKAMLMRKKGEKSIGVGYWTKQAWRL